MERVVTKIFSATIVIVLVGIANINAQSGQMAVPSAQSRETIEQVVREYLVKNPEVVREAMQALQAKEEMAKQAATAAAMKNLKAEIYSDADSPVLGNAKGDVSVVVFYDYFCGYCKKTLPELQAVIAEDTTVRVIYKEFPIMGTQSMIAAKAALAAAKQGKFEAFHQAMLESQSASDASIKMIAGKLGLDYAKLQKDMDDPKITQAIERNIRLAGALSINGTPAYLIGDEFIPGAIGSDALVKIVATQREKQARAEKVTAVKR